MQETVIVLDFGAQYSQLIARRVREHNVYCEILPFNAPLEKIMCPGLKGIILSGGPASVYAKGAPRIDRKIFFSGVPVLGICYGMQLGALLLGGKVSSAPSREYGRTYLKVTDKTDLLKGLPNEMTVWMSHGDQVSKMSLDFKTIARTANSPYAAACHRKLPFWGVQFHPEVTHTPLGKKVFKNFLYNICKCSGNWRMESYAKETITKVRKEVGNKKVVCGLSGGIDSSVAAVLINKAIGKNLTCIFVDNGLLRQDEKEEVKNNIARHFKLKLIVVDAVKSFVTKLKGVTDPEKKRHIIGHEFISVFNRMAKKLGKVDYLVQGTLYPDVIESVSAWGGPTAKIKSHHNVGGLPKNMPFKLIEPLKYLFKDEVREIARVLSFPKRIINRQPFPGPGLGVRIVGEVTAERLAVLRKADAIVREEIERSCWNDICLSSGSPIRRLWQYFAVLLPISSVGVMGDERTYENTAVIRAVESTDGMTADWARLPYELITTISSRITSEVRGINRVVFDTTSKPPSTIEWE
ncbi:MAG: glutamine-hydrolyzing GMP synthase [Planctomycetes bacterium]|nr:glutamine-hydrolyzing GMP synthase [Planctomycetota bacterium]